MDIDESEDEAFIVRSLNASRFKKKRDDSPESRVAPVTEIDDSPVARVTEIDDPPVARVTTKRLYSALEVFQDAQKRGLHRPTEVSKVSKVSNTVETPSLFYVNLMKPLPWENEKEEEEKSKPPVRPVKHKKTRKEIEDDIEAGLIRDIKRTHRFAAKHQRREEAERQAER